MASTSSANDQYSYTRASTVATRALVDSNPASNQQSGTATPSDPTSPHGTLHRRKTNNYESALADRLSASVASEAAETSQSQPVVSSSGLAYRGDSPRADNDKAPHIGLLGRQQSFNQADQKRQQMERMLSSETAVPKAGGYSSAQTA